MARGERSRRWVWHCDICGVESKEQTNDQLPYEWLNVSLQIQNSPAQETSLCPKCRKQFAKLWNDFQSLDLERRKT